MRPHSGSSDCQRSLAEFASAGTKEMGILFSAACTSEKIPLGSRSLSAYRQGKGVYSVVFSGWNAVSVRLRTHRSRLSMKCAMVIFTKSTALTAPYMATGPIAV